MINAVLRRSFLVLVIALLVLVIGLAAFLLTFDPNAYKPRIEALVYAHTDRKLDIEGDLSLSLFPRIGLSVGHVTLSNRDAPGTFLSVDGARFAVAIWPLLSNRLVVDHVAIDGLKAWVTRDADGEFNFSDLLGAVAAPPALPAPSAGAGANAAAVGAPAPAVEPGAGEFNIDIAGLELKGGQIQYLDLQRGLSTQVSQIEARTGRITYDQPFDVSIKARLAGHDPVQDARLEAQALLRLAPAQSAYSANKVQVQLSGRLGNLDHMSASLQGNLAYRALARRFAADHLDLSLAGDVVGAHPVKGLKVQLTAAQLHLDARATELKVAQLALRAQGDEAQRHSEVALDAPAVLLSPSQAQADPIKATLKATGADTLAVSLGLEGLSGRADRWHFASARLQAGLTQGARLFSVTLDSPLDWDHVALRGALSAIKGEVSLRDQALPRGQTEFPLIGSTRLDLVKDVLDLDLNAVIDGAQAAFKSHTQRLSDPQTQFDLNVQTLDLDHWLAPPQAQAPEDADAEGKDKDKDKATEGKATGGKAADQPAKSAEPAAAQAVDLSVLKDKDVQGAVHLGTLKVRGMQLDDLAAKVTLRDGTLTVSDLAAKLYDGRLSGSFSAQAAKPQTLETKLALERVDLGALLATHMDPALLSGRLAAQLQLKSSGQDEDALWTNARGRVDWQLRDGRLHGLDAERTLSDAASALSNVLKGRVDALSSPFDQRRSTAFSRLDGRLDIAGPQATLSRLQVVSDLVRITQGKPATLNLRTHELDVVLRCQVAARAPAALSKTLAPLLGVTVPVQVRGAWEKPAFEVQWSQISNAGIRRALQSGLGELLEGRDLIQQALPTPFDGSDDSAPARTNRDDPVEQIGKALKGLLGR